MAVALGATCTLSMTDTYGDGWDAAEWLAPGFEKIFSLASGIKSPAVQTESFVVQSPPPPGAFTSKAFLKATVLAFTKNADAAIATHGPVADWEVSGISDMSQLFYNLPDFNADVSNWNTSGVTDMSNMFRVRSAHAL